MEIDYGGKEFMNFLLVLESKLAGGVAPARTSNVKIGHS
jgi:hypothetical protein